MTLDVTQNTAQPSHPVEAPNTMFEASDTRLKGTPQSNSLSAGQPCCASQGLTMPQPQKVPSMAALMQKRPVAASSGV